MNIEHLNSLSVASQHYFCSLSHQNTITSLFLSSELGAHFWDDLEADLPDELIPNGSDLGPMSMPSNGGSAGGHGPMVPDAAAKHKQLSELLRPGSSTNLIGSPQPGGMSAQLGGLGKSSLGQGSPSHPSQTQKQGTQGGNAGSAGMGLGTGFNQAMLNSGQPHGMLGQNAGAQQGQAMNGTLGSVGRGRGAAGTQYQGAAMQVAPSVGATGRGAAGSVLAETLSQGAQQMGINAQQAGNITKVR